MQLQLQQAASTFALKESGVIFPHVFFRLVSKGRKGKQEPRVITSFIKAWRKPRLPLAYLASCRMTFDGRHTRVRPGRHSRTGGDGLEWYKTRSVFERCNIVSTADLRETAPSWTARPDSDANDNHRYHLGTSGLFRLDLKSAADPSEAKAEPINRRDWPDPQPHHEQSHIGARDGLIAAGLKNTCECQDYNRPKNRSQ